MEAVGGGQHPMVNSILRAAIIGLFALCAPAVTAEDAPPADEPAAEAAAGPAAPDGAAAPSDEPAAPSGPQMALVGITSLVAPAEPPAEGDDGDHNCIRWYDSPTGVPVVEQDPATIVVIRYQWFELDPNNCFDGLAL